MGGAGRFWLETCWLRPDSCPTGRRSLQCEIALISVPISHWQVTELKINYFSAMSQCEYVLHTYIYTLSPSMRAGLVCCKFLMDRPASPSTVLLPAVLDPLAPARATKFFAPRMYIARVQRRFERSRLRTGCWLLNSEKFRGAS